MAVTSQGYATVFIYMCTCMYVCREVMRDQAEGYVRAIQWNLNYYYNGVCSWSWYYPHHYAPYISDIKDFSNLKLEYDLGKPFQPFEQVNNHLYHTEHKPDFHLKLTTSKENLCILIATMRTDSILCIDSRDLS